jgi:hypothetical protein
MDIYCTNCGEPWSPYYVLHEEPEAFERAGGDITHCPCCESRGKSDNPNLMIVGALAGALGDDIDGLAAAIEDFGLY